MKGILAVTLVFGLVLTSGTAGATPFIDSPGDGLSVITVSCATWGDFCASVVQYDEAKDVVYSGNGGVHDLYANGQYVGTLTIWQPDENSTTGCYMLNQPSKWMRLSTGCFEGESS